MYRQLNKFAVDINYGEGDFSAQTYNNSTETQTTTNQTSGLLPNTGQDFLAITGLGLVLVAVSLFAILRRKKSNKTPKANN